MQALPASGSIDPGQTTAIMHTRLRHRVARILLICTPLIWCLAPVAFAQDSTGLTPSLLTQDPSELAPAPSTWRGAITDSFRLLIIEHTTRVAFQTKTRRELAGNFFRDYHRAVRVPRTWEDGDSAAVNYVGHPIHGAAAGFIWLDHEDGSHDPKLGFSKEYWASRSRALAWAASYSVQFEFGPLSEASIGNVGLQPGTTGWVDHAVTPAGALAFLVAEDALDRYLITRIESWTGNRLIRMVSRMALNPSRTLSNVAQGQTPWFRSVRPLS